VQILKRQEGANFEKPNIDSRPALGILARIDIVSGLHWQKEVGPCKQDDNSLRRLSLAP